MKTPGELTVITWQGQQDISIIKGLLGENVMRNTSVTSNVKGPSPISLI